MLLELPPELNSFIANGMEVAGLGLFVVVATIILGYLSDRLVGALMLALPSLGAVLICLTGYAGPFLLGFFLKPPGDTGKRVARAQGWATAGLAIAIIVVAALAARFGKKRGTSKAGKRRGALFVAGLWLGFCLASWIGHRAGGWVGLLTITLPAVAILWLCLHGLSRFILPLDAGQPVSKAFRCLVTFSAGTNYPYYAMEGRQKVERVPGNQGAMFLAGPGIFLTGPDHVVAVSTGLRFQGVRGPGVVFTKAFEGIQEPMDLRPQQRSYEVEAMTKDGIRVRLNAFGPFQLNVGRQQPRLGEPFPCRARSVITAFHKRPVDIEQTGQEGKEERKRRRWDELYRMIGAHVMQDIIGEYTFDELCQPLEPDEDPRVKIAKQYQERMEVELAEYGIDVPSGGVSNLLPAREGVVLKRRFANWQAQWERKMLEQRGVAEAEGERILGQTRAQVQAEVIQSISEAIAEVTTDDRESIFNTVALRFIESLNQMVAQSPVRDRLPPDVAGTVSRLPRIIGEA